MSSDLSRIEASMSHTVLVVDDEADVRKFLTAVLEKRGFEVLTAEDGQQAYALTERQHPDLIVLDLQMPHQSGTDFYRRLMRHDELREIPIVVVSGLAGRHLAVSHPFAVFDKPIDPDEFGDTVERALGVGME
jgi:CheY-like chemotaxis protein